MFTFSLFFLHFQSISYFVAFQNLVWVVRQRYIPGVIIFVFDVFSHQSNGKQPFFLSEFFFLFCCCANSCGNNGTGIFSTDNNIGMPSMEFSKSELRKVFFHGVWIIVNSEYAECRKPKRNNKKKR